MNSDEGEWTIAWYLRAAGQGDPAAIERLVRYAQRVAAARARAMRLSPEDAEDVAQQVCLLALSEGGEALARVRPPETPLIAWVTGVVRHKLTDLARARAPKESSSAAARAVRRAAQRERVASQRRARLESGGGDRGAHFRTTRCVPTSSVGVLPPRDLRSAEDPPRGNAGAGAERMEAGRVHGTPAWPCSSLRPPPRRGGTDEHGRAGARSRARPGPHLSPARRGAGRVAGGPSSAVSSDLEVARRRGAEKRAVSLPPSNRYLG